MAAGAVKMGGLMLHSCLATQIQSFIDLRRLSGTDYQSQALLLGYFDRFLTEQELSATRITRLITDRYQRSLLHLAPRSQGNRFCVVRQLCKYLARTDPFSFVPEPPRFISSQIAYQAYIYEHDEIDALLAAASKLSPPGSLRPSTYRTLLGLLFTTGIRIGEAIALNLENFEKNEQRLFIVCGKFRKARWIPLSASTCKALEKYVDDRVRYPPLSSDCPLFLNQRSKRLCYTTVNHTFHKLLRHCRIPRNQNASPRIHDLRHSFAVHRLLAWYRDGQDINARLPALATYMGHVNVASTQVYLRPTAELLGEVSRRFHNHFLQHVNPQEVSS
jgi:site-specific recombinase XerD